MCLNETYSKVRVGQHLSDVFCTKKGLKKEDVLSSLRVNFALDDAITRVHVNQGSWKLNGTYQLLAYADVANMLLGSAHTSTIKKNADALVVVCKEIGLEVNDDKTKYVVISQDQNAGLSHNVKICKCISFEIAEYFKYWGTILTNENSIQVEIKSRLKSGSACCHSVHNHLP
jgi:hypothetical protein